MQNNKTETINRQNWRSITFKPSPIPVFVTMSMIGIFGGIIIIFLSFVFASLDSFGSFLIVLLVCIFCYLIYFVVQFLSYSSISYRLLPAHIKKIDNNILDQTPGRLEYSFGLFIKEQQYFPLSEFERVWFFQSPLGKLFNYGHVHIEQTSKLEETKDYSLRNIPNPEKAAKIIQDLIDLETNQATPL